MKATETRPWLKNYRPDDLKLVMPEMSIFDYLLMRNKDRMTWPAMNYFDRIFTVSELVENVYQTANAYASLGVKKDDIVLVCAPTTPETVYTFYGLSLLGAVPNMVDPRYSADGIHEYIEEADIRVIMTIDVAYDKVVEAIKGTKVEKVIVLSPAESLPKLLKFGYLLKNPMVKNLPANFMHWADFIAQGKDHKVEYIHGHQESCCIIVHTGGTTGKSKSVMLSHNAINAVSFQYYKCLMKSIRVAGEDKFLDIMPPFIAYGLGYGVHLPLCAGIVSVLIPKFEPENFAKLVLKHKPQDVAGAPSHFLTLMKDKRMKHADLSFFKNACAGGDNISLHNEEMVSKFLLDHKAPYPLTKGYGMTELSAVATACMLDVNRPGSVGIPHADFLIAAFDPETGEELEMGQIGEICVHGPTMMMGYYKNPEETAHIMRTHADGLKWIHTGDLGYMDEDGFLYIKGRLKRMIIRTDGFKVFPTVIEDVITDCPDVALCTVVGTEAVGEVQGQVPHVFFTMSPESVRFSDEVIEELKTRCKKSLAEYFQPAYFTKLDAMPLTPIGKVDYRLLEEKSAEMIAKRKK